MGSDDQVRYTSSSDARDSATVSENTVQEVMGVSFEDAESSEQENFSLQDTLEGCEMVVKMLED